MKLDLFFPLTWPDLPIPSHGTSDGPGIVPDPEPPPSRSFVHSFPSYSYSAWHGTSGVAPGLIQGPRAVDWRDPSTTPALSQLR